MVVIQNNLDTKPHIIADQFPLLCDLVLFLGQSNMAGRGIVTERFPEPVPQVPKGVGYEYRAISDPLRLYFMTDCFGVLENNPNGINDVNEVGKPMKTGSLVNAFSVAYHQFMRVPIVGVSASKGGSSLLQWQPDAKAGYLKDAVNRYQMALNFLENHKVRIRHKFTVFCQGETDGDLGTSERDYISFFENMWLTLSEVTPKLFMIRIGDCNIEGSYSRYDDIQYAQERICTEHIPDVEMVSRILSTFRQRDLMKDEFHYYQVAYNRCGEEAGRNVAASLLSASI